MARIARFTEHRFVGIRDDMRAYDTDDADQYKMLSERIESEDLMMRELSQTFGPRHARRSPESRIQSRVAR